MSPRHFSKRGGPYFINDGFSRHVDSVVSRTLMNKLKSFLPFFPAPAEIDNPVSDCPCGCPPDNCTCCCSNPAGCAHR